MKILIVEDEKKIGEYLKQGLSEAGFVVDLANDGLNAKEFIQNSRYDLIILDILLPDISGFELIKITREIDKNTPILLLTALSSTADKVKGLDLGADDYIVKPFDFAELLARARSLLRRGNKEIVESDITFDTLHVDLVKRRVERDGARIDLSQKEFLLLELLLKNRDEVITRTQISSEVWGVNLDGGTNVVDVSIKRLRDKIDKNSKKKLIHTIRGMGYVMEIRDE
ncbi:MAG: heavy metal response regulator transcription factor [Campylobacteraceae bacterium]